MNIDTIHEWNVGYTEAKRIQERLVKNLVLRDDGATDHIRTVAGADISYARKSRLFFAAVLVFDYDSMELIEQSSVTDEVDFPYIPGLLTFREGPPLLKAFERLHHTPDVMIFDGQGIAHPRGIGLASHLGLFLEIPSIGCAKTKLVGTYSEPGQERGEYTPLMFNEETIGSVLRTKRKVKPLFISQGHRISLERAVTVVLSTCRGYRLPEPTRQAHLAVNRLRARHYG